MNFAGINAQQIAFPAGKSQQQGGASNGQSQDSGFGALLAACLADDNSPNQATGNNAQTQDPNNAASPSGDGHAPLASSATASTQGTQARAGSSTTASKTSSSAANEAEADDSGALDDSDTLSAPEGDVLNAGFLAMLTMSAPICAPSQQVPVAPVLSPTSGNAGKEASDSGTSSQAASATDASSQSVTLTSSAPIPRAQSAAVPALAMGSSTRRANAQILVQSGQQSAQQGNTAEFAAVPGVDVFQSQPSGPIQPLVENPSTTLVSSPSAAVSQAAPQTVATPFDSLGQLTGAIQAPTAEEQVLADQSAAGVQTSAVIQTPKTALSVETTSAAAPLPSQAQQPIPLDPSQVTILAATATQPLTGQAPSEGQTETTISDQTQTVADARAATQAQPEVMARTLALASTTQDSRQVSAQTEVGAEAVQAKAGAQSATASEQQPGLLHRANHFAGPLLRTQIGLNQEFPPPEPTPNPIPLRALARALLPMSVRC